MPSASPGLAFTAHVSDVRLLSNTLRPIQHASHVVVILSDTGVEFVTDADRSFQAHAYIKRILFPKWNCSRDPGIDSPMNTMTTNGTQGLSAHTFEISLKVLLDCLDIFGNAPGTTKGSSDTDKLDYKYDAQRQAAGGPGGDVFLDRRKGPKTSGILEYGGKGCPLVLMLEDNEVVTRCELTTLEPDDFPTLLMDHTNTQAQLILQAEWITVVLQSFHQSCSRINFCFIPPTRAGNRGSVRIYGETDSGTVDAALPANAKIITRFECARKTEFAYSFQHVSLALRGLQAANKVSIRIDGAGLLSMQCLIPVGQSLLDDAQRGGRFKIEAGHLPIVDYLFCPYEDEDE